MAPSTSTTTDRPCVRDLLAAGAAAGAGRQALVAPCAAPTDFGALIGLVDAAVVELRRRGVGPRDRVAVVLPGGAVAATCCLAVMAGATCVPLNPASTHDEFVELLALLGVARVILAAGGPQAAREAAASVGIEVIELRPTEASAGSFVLTGPPATESVAEPASDPEAPALVLHTSGSTARPKVVALSHANLAASVAALVASLELGPEDRCLNQMPLFHVGALVDLLLAPLAVGGSVAVAPDPQAATFFDCVGALRPTWYQGVPTMLAELLASGRRRQVPGGGLGLRLVRSVSSALPPAQHAELEAWFGVPVIEIYGMSETAGVITSNPLPPAPRKPGSVGIAVGPELRVVDGEGEALPVGADGELEVRGPAVIAAYEGLDPRDHFRDGWLRTGDIGHLDADGYLFLTGRSKELINRGGEKVAPREIDEVALAHPGVRQAAAFGLPHPSLGEEVALAVCLEDGVGWDEAVLRADLSRRLAAHKVPRRILVLDTLPTTPSGKLQRRALPGLIARRDDADGSGPRAPMGATELALIQIWRRVLGVDRVGPDDDFFDLGGDSLKVVSFVIALEEASGVRITGADLLDHPTPAALAAHLDAGDHAGAVLPEVDTPLPRAAYRELYDVVSTWPGARAGPASLMVGLNLAGGAPPIYWSGQSRDELARLAEALGPDQPIYGMRSLRQLANRSDDNLLRLAEHYRDEIAALHRGGPLVVGGFCLGGRIAFHVARGLRERGLDVRALVLVEHFEPGAYDGPVAMVCFGPSVHSPLHPYAEAERGWARYYRGPLAVHRFDCPHGLYWFGPQRDAIAALVRGYAAGSTPAARDAEPFTGPVNPAAACRATLAARLPRVAVTGRRIRLRVSVVNDGDREWAATDSSGIRLAARWLSLNRNIHGGIAGHAGLDQPLASGAGRELELELRAPDEAGVWLLDLDLVDDGVAWFQVRGSTPRRGAVWVLPTITGIPGAVRGNWARLRRHLARRRSSHG